MRKVNLKDIADDSWLSPKEKFSGLSKEISIALGRDPQSTDLKKRHPFDVELCRIPPGKIHSPYHSHSAQWEFYHLISGSGLVRHREGTTPIGPGDAFIFEPDQPHQLINNSSEDLVLYVVADNPIGESVHYPDSRKWLVRSPERRFIGSDGSEELDYYSGEE